MNFYVVCYRHKDMRFAEPRTAVNKQRVVFVRFAGMLRHRFGGGINKLVGRAYHERLEREFGVYRRALIFYFVANFFAHYFQVFFSVFRVVNEKVCYSRIAFFERVSYFFREFIS